LGCGAWLLGSGGGGGRGKPPRTAPPPARHGPPPGGAPGPPGGGPWHGGGGPTWAGLSPPPPPPLPRSHAPHPNFLSDPAVGGATPPAGCSSNSPNPGERTTRELFGFGGFGCQRGGFCRRRTTQHACGDHEHGNSAAKIPSPQPSELTDRPGGAAAPLAERGASAATPSARQKRRNVRKYAAAAVVAVGAASALPLKPSVEANSPATPTTPTSLAPTAPYNRRSAVSRRLLGEATEGPPPEKRRHLELFRVVGVGWPRGGRRRRRTAQHPEREDDCCGLAAENLPQHPRRPADPPDGAAPTPRSGGRSNSRRL